MGTMKGGPGILDGNHIMGPSRVLICNPCPFGSVETLTGTHMNHGQKSLHTAPIESLYPPLRRSFE